MLQEAIRAGRDVVHSRLTVDDRHSTLRYFGAQLFEVDWFHSASSDRPRKLRATQRRASADVRRRAALFSFLNSISSIHHVVTIVMITSYVTRQNNENKEKIFVLSNLWYNS